MLEDLILFNAIIKSNENINIHYLGNHFSKGLADLSNISNIHISSINKQRIINYNNIKEILRFPKNADLAYVFPGMNLKKTSLLKYLLKPKKFIGALLDYPLENLKHIFPNNNYFDKIHYSLKGRPRLEMNQYYLSKYLNVGMLDFDILNYDKILSNNSPNDVDLKDNYMVLHIGSSHEYPIRSLGVNNWQKLINEIIKNYPVKIIFIGNEVEKNIINKIINGIDNKLIKRVINLAGKTSIKQLIKLIFFSEFVISSDSGPGQIAGIMSKKQIMLFGSTNHTLANPINANCIKIYRQYECSPCYESANYYNCPYNNKCMNEISIDTIIQTIALINNRSFKKTQINGDFVERCFRENL